MTNLFCRFAVALVVFPIAAFADLTGTVTVSAGQSLNLETGAAAASGGDLLWSGSTLTPQGKAKAYANPALSGATAYAALTQSLLQSFASLASSAPISGVAPSAVVGVVDNSGNVAKLLATSVSNASITFQYTTYGASGGAPGAPTITAVQNNYSYIVPGLPNYGIAPGTLFIIKGSNLASTTTATLQDPSAGIPTSLSGTSVSVTVGSVTTTPTIYYAVAGQIGAVLPSNTPAGLGTVTVTYNNVASVPGKITVVTSALGLDTYYGTGSGLGVATNPTTGALYNYNNSIPPGTTVVLWGSGLGSTGDSDSTNTSTPHAASNPPTFYIGGIATTALYAGRSVYPGVDQINITIPSAVSPGCAVSVVAVSGIYISNVVTLPVGSGVCSDSATGVTGTQLLTLGGKTNYNSGALFISQSTSSNQTFSGADGIFENYQGSQSASGYGIVSLGSCIINSSDLNALPVFTSTGLDAGTITVTGPAGTQTMNTIPTFAGEYAAQLPSGFIPANGGTFTFKGTGGANVGAFTTSVSYTNPLVWTNSSSITTVNRAGGQNITWTGGAPGSYVYIGGTSSSSTATASFTCYAPVSGGSFTVPSYILLALPAGMGTLGVTNNTTPVSFSASGLDYGVAFGGISFSITPTYN